MLNKMMRVMNSVNVLSGYIDTQVTSWKVYKMLEDHASQSTIYRHIKTAERLGLIEDVSKNSSYDWSLTEKGKELYASQMELPF